METERDESEADQARIVLEGMTAQERRDVVSEIAASRISEDIVIDGESKRSVGELRAEIAAVVDDAHEVGIPDDVIREVMP